MTVINRYLSLAAQSLQEKMPLYIRYRPRRADVLLGLNQSPGAPVLATAFYLNYTIETTAPPQPNYSKGWAASQKNYSSTSSAICLQ